jgi:hypothetical protein
MNDTVKMFLISLITAVLVQVLLGPQIIKMQMQQGLLPALTGPPSRPCAGPAGRTPPTQPVVTPPPDAAQIPAPNFVGTPIRDARKVASGQGIVLIEDESRDAPDAQPGEILEQIPPPGTPLVNREIRVVTAKAKEARIPNLVGKPIAEAKQTLSDLGVEVTEVQKDSSKTPGTVISQKPLPNSKLSPGTPVELTIAALPLIQVPGPHRQVPQRRQDLPQGHRPRARRHPPRRARRARRELRAPPGPRRRQQGPVRHRRQPHRRRAQLTRP